MKHGDLAAEVLDTSLKLEDRVFIRDGLQAAFYEDR
jgi:hypothetical protein